MEVEANKGNREWKVNPKTNTVTIYKVTKKGLSATKSLKIILIWIRFTEVQQIISRTSHI